VRGALLLCLLAQAPDPGALEALADGVCSQVRAAGATAPLAVSVTAPGHPALAQAFSTLLLARLSAAGLGPRVLDSPEEARAGGARALLRVRLTLDGRLAAAGDVLPTWDNLFSGRAQPHGKPAAVVFVEVAPDGAVRALARAPDAPALLLATAPLAEWPVRTAALATGDLDGDGRPEVAVLTEDAVEVRGRDGRLLARRPLLLLPPAEVPARETFGTLCICGGLLYAFSAAHAGGQVLALQDGALVPLLPLSRPVVGCGPPRLEATLLPGVARLAPSGPGWPSVPEGPAAWGLAVRPAAAGPGLLLLREDGTALLRMGSGPWQTASGVGAGAALVDMSGDGSLRLAASGDGATAGSDSLRLLRLEDGAAEGSVDVPGRIVQVAAAALEGRGAEALLLGVWLADGGAQLRLVRGAR